MAIHCNPCVCVSTAVAEYPRGIWNISWNVLTRFYKNNLIIFSFWTLPARFKWYASFPAHARHWERGFWWGWAICDPFLDLSSLVCYPTQCGTFCRRINENIYNRYHGCPENKFWVILKSITTTTCVNLVELVCTKIFSIVGHSACFWRLGAIFSAPSAHSENRFWLLPASIKSLPALPKDVPVHLAYIRQTHNCLRQPFFN